MRRLLKLFSNTALVVGGLLAILFSSSAISGHYGESGDGGVANADAGSCGGSCASGSCGASASSGSSGDGSGCAGDSSSSDGSGA